MAYGRGPGPYGPGSLKDLSRAVGIPRSGQKLINKYQTYQHAEGHLAELILCIQGIWLKTEVQIDTLRRIWKDLGTPLQMHQHQVLQVLHTKLQAAVTEIDSLIGIQDENSSAKSLASKKGPIKKGKMVVFERCIERAIRDMDMWQKRFDPSWFLITRVASSNIDGQLNKQLRNDNCSAVSKLKELRDALQQSRNRQDNFNSIGGTFDGYWTFERRFIQHCSAQILSSSHRGDQVVADTTTYPEETDMFAVYSHVQDLARILARVDPSTFNLLSCRCLLQVPSPSRTLTQFEIIFNIPSGLENPLSLRSLLLQPKPRSLDERFQLARSLARSVMFVHSSGFVHKNIRPETVIVFQKQQASNETIVVPFLVGFERFRPVEGDTFRLGDDEWQKNIYRHPKRQGEFPEDVYIMQHDIYSLGVCLLEIGLWTSFLLWPVIDEATNPRPPPEPHAELTQDLMQKDIIKAAFDTKRKLVRMAIDDLPSRMGKKYTRIVQACLTCLDPGDGNGFGNESDLEDDDGIAVGVHFIENVRYSHPNREKRIEPANLNKGAS
ncbi:MAG: 45 kDa subunit of RNA polymerase II [Watsoniomyces obsoletus]|nr:MAG: 45 kDa subunit of RNA polymerase II [Watsoniomyces obsoletus]